MPLPAFAFLPLLDRGVVSVTGAEAVAFLDNLATNTLDDVVVGNARFAALLTPQGKIAYEFFAVRTADGFLLDTHRTRIADFIKRLSLYKLRAKVSIRDETGSLLVAVCPTRPQDSATIAWADPRNAALGFRVISRDPTLRLVHDPANEDAYHRLRVSLGIPEAGIDYPLGDTFPHEANYDRIHGVSFSKGCFVGQEVVARMQNKTVVRKRVVKVTGDSPLTSGAAITVGDAEIGTIGTVDGPAALALVRLDRAIEAVEAGRDLIASGAVLAIDAAELDAYKASAARRAAQPTL